MHESDAVRFRLATGNVGVMAATNEEVKAAQFPILIYLFTAIIVQGVRGRHVGPGLPDSLNYDLVLRQFVPSAKSPRTCTSDKHARPARSS